MTSGHDVVIAGAGPTGTVLACELALAGVDALVVERRASPELEGSRAGGLHCRTIELLDQRGVAERFLEAGTPMQVLSFAGVPLSLEGFPTRHPYGLALWQSRFEEVLGGWAAELGVRVLRGSEVVGVEQDEAGVDVALAGGGTLRARWLVGCDGGRSAVRRAAGIAFPGWGPSTSAYIAEAEFDGEPELGMKKDERGIHGMGPLEDGCVRVVVRDGRLRLDGPPTLEQLRAAIAGVWGQDFGLRGARWLSWFTDATRQAAEYRRARVLLAGDAAHVHWPVGGQGLNLGVHEAMDLGWKLAAVVRGAAPDDLLDTYHAERHPAAARVLRMTMAQTVLQRGAPREEALSAVLAERAGALAPLRESLAAELSGLDVAYDLGEGHPLLGRRVPDVDLLTPDGPTRAHALLRRARPVLLDLGGGAGAPELLPGTVHVRATCEGPWVLPVLGEVPPPAAVLVRPDGHVAWVAER